MNADLAEFRARRAQRDTMVGNVRWTYVSAGSGPTVLLLHGMAGSADIWFQQIEALSTSRQVVAVTYPEVTSLAELRAGIIGVLTTEDVDRYAVVGSSLGGYLAQYLVATEGDRVTAAVFANTFPPNPVIAKRSKNLAALARVLPASVVGAFLRRNLSRQQVPAGDDSALLRQLLGEQYERPDFKRLFLSRYQCVIDPFELPRPEIPVLLVSSDNDPLVGADLRDTLWAAYPGADVHEFQGGGHFPYVNRAAEYTAVLDEFLPRTPPRR